MRQIQSISLPCKVDRTKRKIREWYDHWQGDVSVSISGKDSTCLLHIVRSIYPSVPAVFVDTGLEYPEVRDHIKTLDNVTWLRPAKTFKKVIAEYGYPVVSKDQSCAISRFRNTKSYVQKVRRIRGWPNGKKGCISKKWRYLLRAPFPISDACCDIMKKRPLKKYTKETGNHPMIGAMASDSKPRMDWWREHGCNAFDLNDPISRPLSHWLEEDIWQYLRENNIPYAKVYDMGYDRTGCMFCMFGLHQEGQPNRFQRMYHTHPKQWAYCMDKLGLREVLEYLKVPCEPEGVST